MASENDKIAFRLAVTNGTAEQQNQARNLAAAFEMRPQFIRSQIYKLEEERKARGSSHKLDREIAEKKAQLKRAEEEIRQEDFLYNLLKGIFGL